MTGAALPRDVRIRHIAHGKSGDKGNSFNIGVIALERAYFPLLVRTLTAERVNLHFGRAVDAPTIVYELPNLAAVNVVVHDGLEGGGTASLRADSMAKNLANVLFDMPVGVSTDEHTWLSEVSE
jgi:hypothetical protein